MKKIFLSLGIMLMVLLNVDNMKAKEYKPISPEFLLLEEETEMSNDDMVVIQ